MWKLAVATFAIGFAGVAGLLHVSNKSTSKALSSTPKNIWGDKSIDYNTPAAFNSMRLDKPMIVCKNYSDSKKLSDLSSDGEVFGKFLNFAMAKDFCNQISAGSHIFAEQKIGYHYCIRPKGEFDCRWGTLDSSAQYKFYLN